MTSQGQVMTRSLLEAYHEGRIDDDKLLRRAVRILEDEAAAAGMVDTWTPRPPVEVEAQVAALEEEHADE